MAVNTAPAPLPQIRQGLPGEIRREGRVYAIAFDMDIEALRANQRRDVAAVPKRTAVVVWQPQR